MTIPSTYVSPLSPDYTGGANPNGGSSPPASAPAGDGAVDASSAVFSSYREAHETDGKGGTYHYGGYGFNAVTNP